MMSPRSGGLSAILVLLLLVGGFVFLLVNNAPSTEPLRVIIPTQSAPTPDDANAWKRILEAGFGADTTPLPTVPLPTAGFSVPTLAIAAATPIAPDDVAVVSGAQSFSIGATPTPLPPTALPLATTVPLTAIAVSRPSTAWQPPPLMPPISRDALGRDHYYLMRPVDSNANNRGLFYYGYGSDGPENNWRLHAGIDMPNDIGQTVRAAGAGVIVWAAPSYQNTFSYGNVVAIAHDFGHEGRRIYTLYAHLSAILVSAGQTVAIGDPIGLVGNTGRVSGPHVHFEVRLAPPDSSNEPTYGDTYNPVLWMVPYVGTGVIAGRVTDARGRMVMDADVTIRSLATGLTADTSTTYIFLGSEIDVNPDPIWNENFAVSDLPVGRYEVIAVIDGVRVSQIVSVLEGTTAFVELAPAPPATSAPDAGG